MRRSPARRRLYSRTWWRKSSGPVRSRPRARRRRRASRASAHPIARRTYQMRRGRWGFGAARSAASQSSAVGRRLTWGNSASCVLREAGSRGSNLLPPIRQDRRARPRPPSCVQTVAASSPRSQSTHYRLPLAPAGGASSRWLRLDRDMRRPVGVATDVIATAPRRPAEPRRGACWRWIESGSAAPLLAEGLPPYVGGSLSLPCRRR